MVYRFIICVFCHRQKDLGQHLNSKCEHLSSQGEQLYTVKLYKGRHEFLQLVPSKETPLKTFPLKGVNVQVRIYKEKMHNYRKRSNISSDSNLFLKIQTAHSCPKDV